ncbi:MAG: hypothetical protein ACXACD_05700 [Candidatus Thorarchaeota archaeon]|jgi:hypothetical protein
MKRYIIIQEKLCQETGRFKTFVFNKAQPAFSSKDQQELKQFDCQGFQQPFRHIEIDLESGVVSIARSTISEFPDGYQLFVHDHDRDETTQLIQSDA